MKQQNKKQLWLHKVNSAPQHGLQLKLFCNNLLPDIADSLFCICGVARLKVDQLGERSANIHTKPGHRWQLHWSVHLGCEGKTQFLDLLTYKKAPTPCPVPYSNVVFVDTLEEQHIFTFDTIVGLAISHCSRSYE